MLLPILMALAFFLTVMASALLDARDRRKR